MTISEWRLNMKETASAVLSSLSGKADSTAGHFNNLQAKINGSASPLGKLPPLVSSIGSGFSALVPTIAAASGALVAAVGFDRLEESAVKAQSLYRALKLIDGGALGANNSLKYIKDTANQFGQSFESISKGYKTIGASARGTSIAGQGVKDVLEGVTAASAALGLTNDESEGALLAISQMISKGKVSAEELRGQLGERIPGAFQIAARAMNMTTGQLDKLVSTGNLAATDFIPKFAQQMKKEFAGSVEEAANSISGAKNRMINNFEYLKEYIGGNMTGAFTSFYTSIGNGFQWLQQNFNSVIDAFKTLGVAVVAGTSTFLILNGILKLNAWYVAGSELAFAAHALIVGETSLAWATLNGIMSVNPIVAVAAGVAALTAGVYYLWNHSETFRGVLVGTWEVVKGFFRFLGKVIEKVPFLGWIYKLIFKFSETKEKIIGVGNSISDFFTGVKTWIANSPIGTFFESIRNGISKLGEKFGWVKDLMSDFFQSLKILAEIVLGPIIKVFDKLFGGVSAKFKAGYAEGASAFHAGLTDKNDPNYRQMVIKSMVESERKLSWSDSRVIAALKKSGFAEDEYSSYFKTATKPTAADASLNKSIKEVTDGGSKVRNIYVNIKNGVEKLEVHVLNAKEGASEIQRIIEESIIRAVGGAEIALGNE